MFRAAWLLARTLLFAALPFFLLVRGSVAAHTAIGAHGWISLVLGMGLATTCLTLLASRLWRRLTGRERSREIARNLALPLVLVFCVYCLGWLSGVNAKTEEIRGLYAELHPSLRLAIGTAILFDSDVVITEIARARGDYTRMGLSPLDDSLHFVQPDGWIHAIDLRTRGRSELRNGLAWLTFRVMGFRALRHGGTGDHLHIALPRPST
ncbi:MAG: hypothetical protein CL908_02385 [Deltaproteobacteria bacterium]|nr:hypothetical protein [Deltaproteobacteria bacterium]